MVGWGVWVVGGGGCRLSVCWLIAMLVCWFLCLFVHLFVLLAERSKNGHPSFWRPGWFSEMRGCPSKPTNMHMDIIYITLLLIVVYVV